MTRSRDTANTQYNLGGAVAPYVAGKNVLINGNFDIWQRGTSGFTTNNTYTADRWFVYSQTNYSLSQETSVIPSGSTYAAKITITGANGFCNLANTLEQIEVERLAGQTVTFSVNLRANSTYNGSTAIQINYSTTGNSQLATWTNLTGTTVTPSTSAYTRVSVTATIPTNAKGLQFYIGQNSVLANGSIYYIAQAQAEIGSIATPFSRAGGSIGGELALCQRYYYRISAGASYSRFSMPSAADGTTVVHCGIPMPVTIRNLVSVDYANCGLIIGGTVLSISSLAFSSNQNGYQFVVVAATTTGLTSGTYYAICAQNAAGTGYLAINGEL